MLSTFYEQRILIIIHIFMDDAFCFFLRERSPCVCRGKLDSRETGAAAGDHRGSRRSLLDLCPLVDQSLWTRLPWTEGVHLDLSLAPVNSSYGVARVFLRPAHDRARGPGPSRTDPAQCPGRAGTWLPGEEVSLLPRFILFYGPGAGFMVHEIQGGAPSPAVCFLSGYGYELRSQLRVPRAFSWERRTEREVAGHLRDPAGWA